MTVTPNVNARHPNKPSPDRVGNTSHHHTAVASIPASICSILLPMFNNKQTNQVVLRIGKTRCDVSIYWTHENHLRPRQYVPGSELLTFHTNSRLVMSPHFTAVSLTYNWWKSNKNKVDLSHFKFLKENSNWTFRILSQLIRLIRFY